MKKLLFTAIVLAVFGAGGWYYWQHRDNSKNSSPISQNQNSQTTNQETKYLVLEQFRVRIPLDDQTLELKLGATKQSSYSENDMVIDVFAPSLDSTWQCTILDENDKAGIGNISITTDEKRGGPYEPVATKKIASNTYGFEPNSAHCSTGPRHADLVEAFKIQFQKMEAY